MSSRVRFVGPLDRALFLRRVPLLSGFHRGELGLVAEYARERHVGKGEVLLRKGEYPDAFYIVVEGSVKVVGGPYPGGVCLGPGETVGLLVLLAQAREGVDATAERDSLLLEFEADFIFDLFEAHFYILHQVIRSLARLQLSERRTIPAGQRLGSEQDLFCCPDRSLDLVERMMVMRRPDTPFSRSSLDGLARLVRRMTEARHPAGTELWKAGEPSGTVHMIVTGEVACTQPDGRGTFHALPGYPLGNLESLAAEPRWYTAVTARPTIALSAESESFLDVLEDDFEMAMDFLTAFASGLIRIRSESFERAAKQSGE